MKNNFEADYLPLITASLEKTIQDKVDASVATSEQPVGDNVKAELYNTLYNELSSTLSTQIYDNLLTTLSANISNEIATEVEASLLKENDIETITVPSTPTVEPETETTTPEIVSEEPAEESVIPETVSEEPVVESVTPVIEEEPVVETVTPAEVSTVSTEPQEMTQEEYIIKRKEARTTAISDILAGLQD